MKMRINEVDDNNYTITINCTKSNKNHSHESNNNTCNFVKTCFYFVK